MIGAVATTTAATSARGRPTSAAPRAGGRATVATAPTAAGTRAAASPHWPVRAAGESMTKVAESGRPFGGAAYEPFRPTAASRMTDGVEATLFTMTLMMPWMPPRPFLYCQAVCDAFTFHPVCVA